MSNFNSTYISIQWNTLINAKHSFWIVIFLLTELFYIAVLLFTFWVVIRQKFTSLTIYFVISFISTCWYKCSMLCNIGFVFHDITLHGTRNTIVWLDVFSRIKRWHCLILCGRKQFPANIPFYYAIAQTQTGRQNYNPSDNSAQRPITLIDHIWS